MQLLGIFQERCLVCACRIKTAHSLCSYCLGRLTDAGQKACLQCAEPISTSGMRCGQCLQHPPAFDQTRAVFVYDEIIRHLVQRFKFYGDFSVLPFLSKAMLRHLSAHYQNQAYPELLLPVPLYWTRLFKRGFNQTLELAKMLSRDLPVKLDPSVLRKVKQTKSQADLDFTERSKNLKAVFVLQKIQTLPKSVAILDDVMTTGATLNEVAKTLKKQGVKDVHVWVVARACKTRPDMT